MKQDRSNVAMQGRGPPSDKKAVVLQRGHECHAGAAGLRGRVAVDVLAHVYQDPPGAPRAGATAQL